MSGLASESSTQGESDTVELPTHVDPPAPAARQRSGFWRELSGALALGLCALAAVVVVLQIVARLRGTPGPGGFTVVGHLVTAGVAMLAQWFADRRRGWQGTAATVVVLVIGGLALWMFWWA